jgi:hypothetical protein
MMEASGRELEDAETKGGKLGGEGDFPFHWREGAFTG